MVFRIVLGASAVACSFGLQSTITSPGHELDVLGNNNFESHCSPSKEQVQSIQPTTPPLKDALFNGSAWNGVKFFLHDNGVFNFTNTVTCFFNALGGTQDTVLLDDVLMPNVAENIADVFLIDQLKNHPGRVYHADAADVHIIGAAIGTSFHAAQLDGQPCGTLAEHYNRVTDVLVNMTNQTARNWLLIDTDWCWHGQVLTTAFGDFMKQKGVMFATLDHTIADYGGMPYEDVVVIPYKAHARLDDERGPAPNVNGRRKTSFTFHGNMKRRNSGRLRFRLFDITDGLPYTSVIDVNFKKDDVKAFSAISRTTASTLLDSAFCLVPAGDTPSSRRLFDALSAGCIPIILNVFETATENLPFSNSIDWAQVAYFAGSLECISEHINETKAWLQSLWNAQLANDTYVARKRAIGQQVFSEMLSYAKGDVASPMLAELGVQLSRRGDIEKLTRDRLNHVKQMAKHHALEIPVRG